MVEPEIRWDLRFDEKRQNPVLHGVRMALGALVMFGQSSNFTFKMIFGGTSMRASVGQVDGMSEDTW